MKKRMLTAIQPTNNLTLGNYLGAIKPFVDMQSQHEAFMFVADLHSLTVRNNPNVNQLEEARQFKDQILSILATYIASGVDPNVVTLFIQSQVPQHAELNWIFNCFSYMGELGRMHQFKDKSQKQGERVNVGLLTYPVLMAADILLYDTNIVPVGEDQKQHLELARDIGQRLNMNYGDDTVVIPVATQPINGARVMGLKNPTEKMSKSNPESAVFLVDSPEKIMDKFKRATTDSLPAVAAEEQSPGVANLLAIQAAILNKSYNEMLYDYVGKQYGYLKKETGELVVETLNPVRTKIEHLLSDETELFKFSNFGKEKATTIAEKTLARIKERMGFVI